MISARNAAQGAEARLSLWTAVWTQFAVSALTLVALILVTSNVGYFYPIRVPLLIVGVALLLSAVPQVTEALLIAGKRMPQVSIAKVAGMLVTTGFVVAAASKSDLSIAFWGLALSYFVTAGVTAGFSHAHKLLPVHFPTGAQVALLLKESAPMLIMSLVTWLYIRIDVLMIDHMIGKSAVAYYSAAYGFLDYLMLLSNAVMVALFPNFAEVASASNPEFKRLYRKTLLLFVTYFFPLAAIVAVFATPILTVLYGSDYSVGASSLVILMIAAVFAWFNGPSGTILISLRRQHLYMIGTCVSLVVNIAGNLILIPRIGIDGAAWSTALTEIALCIFSLTIIYKEVGYLPFLSPRPRGFDKSSSNDEEARFN